MLNIILQILVKQIEPKTFKMKDEKDIRNNKKSYRFYC